MTTFRQGAIATGRAIRTAWMIIGISVAIFVFAESCYRAQDALRGSLGHSSSSGRAPDSSMLNPVLSQPWYPEFAREFDASSPQAWKPWVYFRRAKAYHGTYVNIDTLRHRITPQPSEPAIPTARVFFFGGSTTWGSFLRDDHTIPAVVAKRFQATMPAGERIEVTNLAETGHVTTQGLLELIMQLRAGQRPDVVVFYDGINDAFSTLQNGEAGVGQNEINRANDFTMGRTLVWDGHPEGLKKDLHSYWVLGLAAAQRVALVRRLAQIVHPAQTRPLISLDSATRSTVRVYTENMRIVEALGRTYGFTPLFVWQPTIHATTKVLTPYEKRLMARIEADPLQHRLKQLHIAVQPPLDSAMATVAPGRFVDDGKLFGGDTMAVFADGVGHNTEQAIPVIVDSFWPKLDSLVLAKVRAGHPGPRTK